MNDYSPTEIEKNQGFKNTFFGYCVALFILSPYIATGTAIYFLFQRDGLAWIFSAQYAILAAMMIQGIYNKP